MMVLTISIDGKDLIMGVFDDAEKMNKVRAQAANKYQGKEHFFKVMGVELNEPSHQAV